MHQLKEIDRLTRIACNAMDEEYLRVRGQSAYIAPNWAGHLDKRYEGTVYEKKEIPAMEKQTYIDPHHRANLQLYVEDEIAGIIFKREKDFTFDRVISQTPKRLKNTSDFGINLAIVGLKAAAAAYQSPDSPAIG